MGITNLDSLTVASNLIVTGATTLTGAVTQTGATTFAGASQFNAAVTVGVDDTGYDIKAFGATAGAFLLWDESADTLDVRGATAAGPGTLLLSTGELTNVDGGILGRIDFQAPLDSAGTDAILVGASIWAEADGTFSASVNETELVFATASSETAVEQMRLDKIGQLGINTATPASLLDVQGTVQVGVDDTGYDVKFFGATAGAYMLWDESADNVLLGPGSQLDITAEAVMIDFKAGAASAIDPSATAETGWINVAVDGTTRYIPFYAVS